MKRRAAGRTPPPLGSVYPSLIPQVDYTQGPTPGNPTKTPRTPSLQFPLGKTSHHPYPWSNSPHPNQRNIPPTSPHNHKSSPFSKKSKDRSPATTKPRNTHTHPSQPPLPPHPQRSAPHEEAHPRGHATEHLKETNND